MRARALMTNGDHCAAPVRGGSRAALPVALLLIGLQLCAGSGARAQPATHACDVLNDLISGTEPRLFRVGAGTPRLNFVKSDAEQTGCPQNTAACAARAYLVAGDPVIVTEQAGDFVCAAFAVPKGKGSETSGWLPLASLEERKAAAPGVQDWLGHWRAGVSGDIKITQGQNGKIRLDGNALYGAGDPDRVARGAVNTGEFDATLKAAGDKIGFSVNPAGETRDYGADAGDTSLCRVRLWLRGPYLAVADNMQCGGANVTFTGIYRREAEPKGKH